MSDDGEEKRLFRDAVRGDVVMQREKFLFYRGVGTFPIPVTAKALGGFSGFSRIRSTRPSWSSGTPR